jgi:uncharacterized Fe-S cluster-containing radical SAM superfamily protein
MGINNPVPELNLKGTGLTSTLRCSLKCKLCCTYSPYYNPAPHFSYETLAKTVDKYFKIVNHVGKFTISGGEPFLHEDLHKVIEKVSGYFDQIDTFEIITNGTIIPKDDVIEAIKKYRDKMNIMIDHYGDLSRNINEVSRIFTENGINFRIRDYCSDNPHCGGWVDFGDFSQKHFTKEDIEAKFNKCAYPGKLQFCFSTMGGEMHPCTPSRRCMELGIIPRNKGEYIDLFDENVSIEEQRQKFYDILNMKSLSACAYCNGLCDDSERFMPAEQLK